MANEARRRSRNESRQKELENKKTAFKKSIAALGLAVSEVRELSNMFGRTNPFKKNFLSIVDRIIECENYIMEAIRVNERNAIKYGKALQKANYINAYRLNTAFAYAFAEMLDHPSINQSGLVGSKSIHGRGIGKTKMRTAIPMIMTLIYIELSVIGNQNRLAKFMGYRPELLKFVFHSLTRRGFIVKAKTANGKNTRVYILSEKGRGVAEPAKKILDDHLSKVSTSISRFIEHYTGGRFADDNDGKAANAKLDNLREIFSGYNHAASFIQSVINIDDVNPQ